MLFDLYVYFIIKVINMNSLMEFWFLFNNKLKKGKPSENKA